jgi:hypothetical protein
MLVVEAELLPPARYQAGGAGRGVINAERAATRFADAACYTNVKTEITQVTGYLRDSGRDHRAWVSETAAGCRLRRVSVIHVAPTELGPTEPTRSPMRVSS